MFDQPHRRLNPLTGDWILVSPQRTKRPWNGQVEKTPSDALPPYDPTCTLCPGNRRASGHQNSAYTGAFVFENDFAALLQDTDVLPLEKDVLFQSIAEAGNCRVVCFSPRHDLTIPELDVNSIEHVVRTWAEQVREMSSQPGIAAVQVFENKGAMMGCSNPHPHSQIWSQSMIPNEIRKELDSQEMHFAQYHSPLLSDYLVSERERGERIALENDHFTALVPYWAAWPFEVLVIAHRAVKDLPSLTEEERFALADLYRRLSIRYDNLFETSFPYSMGFHQAPNDGSPHPEWVLHAHFYPPLLRSATVRKYMVGYELLAMPQRDISPESAAERLRTVSEVHYKQQTH